MIHSNGGEGCITSIFCEGFVLIASLISRNDADTIRLLNFKSQHLHSRSCALATETNGNVASTSGMATSLLIDNDPLGAVE